MTGTLLNIVAVLVGGGLGLIFGARLPKRLRETVLVGLGLFTVAFGVSLFLDSQNPLIVVISLVLGAVIGELLGLENRISQLGAWLERRFGREGEAESRDLFIKGFLTTSVLFCVGPMAILGAIQDGLTGDYELLAVKSVLDAFASLAFASTLGVGVLFSSLSVGVYQGSISLLAVEAQGFLTDAMIVEMTAAGGVMILGLGIGSLLELRPIRTANLLPALLIAPLVVKLLEWAAPVLLTIGGG